MTHEPTTTALRPAPVPAADLGMASLTLGTVGLVLAILPVLGIPVSAIGLLLGLAGLARALLARREDLRRTVMGTVLCAMALGANLLVSNAARGYEPNYPPPPTWREPPNRPYVPPPAPPG